MALLTKQTGCHRMTAVFQPTGGSGDTYIHYDKAEQRDVRFVIFLFVARTSTKRHFLIEIFG
jgi:hypothetical protein